MPIRFLRRRGSGPEPDAVDSVPRLRVFIPQSVQHVIVAYTGMATVPLVIGLGIGLSSAQIAMLVSANVLIGGVATLVQTLGVLNIGVRLPIIMGSTFTAITPAILVGQQGGLPAIFGATIVVGLITWLVAPWFSKILRFFPPVVTGTTIAIIGFSLLPSTASLIAGDDPAAPEYGSPDRLLLALGTIILFLLLERFAGKTLSRFAILIAIGLGTVAALPLGLADFSAVGDAAWFGVVRPFEFGLPTFTLVAIIPMLFVQLVNMIESTGDTIATGQVVGRHVGPRDVARSLRADGVSTAFAGVFNSFPFVTFSNNVGLLSLTRVTSRFMVAGAGLILILIGFMPKIGASVASLPEPVLGAIALVIFGTVGAIGVKILVRADMSRARNHLIIAVAFGMAFLPVGSPDVYAQLPDGPQTLLSSGIAVGGLTAFVLNLLLNGASSDGDTTTEEMEGEGKHTAAPTATMDGAQQTPGESGERETPPSEPERN